MGSSTKKNLFCVHRVLGFFCLRRDSTAISCASTFVPSSDNCCSCSFMLGSARRLALAKGGRNLSVSSAKPSPCQRLSFHKRSRQAASRSETSRDSNYYNNIINGRRETRGGTVEIAGAHELRHRCLSTAAHQKMQPPPGEGVPRSAPGASATAAAAVAAAAAAVIGAVAVTSLAGGEDAEDGLGEGVKLSPLSARTTGPWPFLARPRVECAYRRKIQDMYHLVDSPVGQGEAAQSVWILCRISTSQTYVAVRKSSGRCVLRMPGTCCTWSVVLSRAQPGDRVDVGKKGRRLLAIKMQGKKNRT